MYMSFIVMPPNGEKGFSTHFVSPSALPLYEDIAEVGLGLAAGAALMAMLGGAGR